MKYVCTCNFDAGHSTGKKGEPFAGNEAESLLKEGLIEKAQKDPEPEKTPEPEKGKKPRGK